MLQKEQLDRGLAAQATTGRPLGAAIVDNGELDEDALLKVLCDQLHLARAGTFDPYGISLSLLGRLPEHCAKALSVFPIEEKDDGKIVLACAVVPDRRGMLELEAALGGPVSSGWHVVLRLLSTPYATAMRGSSPLVPGSALSLRSDKGSRISAPWRAAHRHGGYHLSGSPEGNFRSS